MEISDVVSWVNSKLITPVADGLSSTEFRNGTSHSIDHNINSN